MFNDDFQEDDGIEIVGKYEELRKSRSPIFFDVDEFGSIIDFYLRNNKYNLAFEATDLASDLHPDSAEIQLKKAQVYITKGKNEDALDLIEALKKKDPFNFEIILNEGIAFLNMNEPVKSRACMKKALELSDSNEDKADIFLTFAREYVIHSLSDEAITCFENAMILDDSIDEYFDFAEFCLENEKYIEAIEILEQMIEKDPFHINGWLNLAGAYIYTKRENDALNALDYVLAIKPDESFAYYLTGLCFFNTDNHEKALEALKKSLELDPKSSSANKLIADIHWQSENPAGAKSYLEKYLEVIPSDAEAFFMLYSISDNNPELKRDSILKANELDPENVVYNVSLAYEYIKEHKYSVASVIAENAVKADPLYDRAWVMYSVAEYYLSSPLEAWRIIIRGLRVLGGMPSSLLQLLSFYCFMMKRLRAGWRYFFLSVSFVNSNPKIPYFFNEYFDTKDFNKFIQNKKN